ncbi:MAG TPA: MBL fold metallo-hydrolase [Terriglobales bacterium]|jgi:glyoxylase-like metal-dependent hydrolase (beta-lactamase superfamily II)|nr:MBL fold metallo-hydrolase [Terriglobales bacterium]
MKAMVKRWLLATAVLLCAGFPARAQDLGPGFTKVKDGIYVYAAKDGNSTCSVVLTQEGPVIIDACQRPPDTHHLMAGVKKLTDKPVRFLIDTEVHNDHTFGHWVFSPPAVVINAEGAGAAMKKGFDPKRASALAGESAEMAEAVKGYKMVVPQIEYKDRMTINLGERTFELYYLKNVHSEADTAIWLPKERVLFAASAANVKSIINLRPFVRIPDVLASYKLMKSLNPEFVVPGHGAVSTTKIFDEYEAFYTLLMKRVGEMAAQGKSLDEIKKELKMPEYADWAGQNNLPQNITVAYASIKK